MNHLFNAQELPIAALQQLGLFAHGEILMDKADLEALLSGRRTGLLSLADLRADNFVIDRLDARVSLTHNSSKQAEIRLHPIYKKAIAHPLLSEAESKRLISGEQDYIQKKYADSLGGNSLMNFEYDKITKDFVSYFPQQVQVPQAVNGFLLSRVQELSFQNGEMLELDDGTRIQHRASEGKGLRANRAALILSVLLDGAVSHYLLQGIAALNNQPQSSYATSAYQDAHLIMQEQLRKTRDNAHDISSQQYSGLGSHRSR